MYKLKVFPKRIPAFEGQEFEDAVLALLPRGRVPLASHPFKGGRRGGVNSVQTSPTLLRRQSDSRRTLFCKEKSSLLHVGYFLCRAGISEQGSVRCRNPLKSYNGWIEWLCWQWKRGMFIINIPLFHCQRQPVINTASNLYYISDPRQRELL